MNQAWKIVLSAIIAAVIAGGGVYCYWQNSKNSLPTTIVKETNENFNDTTNWKAYSNLGISIKYPNDGSYSIETPEASSFTISQEHPGNRIHVSKKASSSFFSGNEKTKSINDKSYKIFYREGMGSGYGYVTEYNGQFYTFESTMGPENEIFELIMTTIKFE